MATKILRYLNMNKFIVNDGSRLANNSMKY